MQMVMPSGGNKMPGEMRRGEGRKEDETDWRFRTEKKRKSAEKLQMKT